MHGEKLCPECGHEHDHPYSWCQECEFPMNGGATASFWVTRAFRMANEGGYTQYGLHKENVEGAKRGGHDLEKISRS